MKKINFKFDNKVVLITGASKGLGYEIAKNFLKFGANLIICSRNLTEIKKTYNNLQKIKNNYQKIIYAAIDVSSQKQVDKFINNSIKKFKKIDILINNAAVIGPKGHIEKVSWDEWVKTININLLGSILVIKKIIPFFKKKNRGKIIQLSGGGATAPFPMLSSYAVSKVGIVRFIENLSLEIKEYNIDINSVAPGIMNTGMIKNILSAGKNKIGKENYKKFSKAKKEDNTDFKNICDLIMFLGSSYSNGISGKLISAYWDNWEGWPNYKKLLKNSDIYTIRRIVGKDRGFNSGDISNS